MEIWLPGQAPPKFVCRVPTDEEGGICGHPFYGSEVGAYQRHVSKCAKEHVDVIRALSRVTRLPEIYDPESGDPEYEHFVHHIVPEKGWVHEDGTWQESAHRPKRKAPPEP